MQINKENFTTARYDVFSLFNDRWALCTAGGPDHYNTMTIGWGTMGTIWGPPKGGKQIVTVFLRESRYTTDILLQDEHFTVCFFPEVEAEDYWACWASNPAGPSPIRLPSPPSRRSRWARPWASKRRS